MYLLPSSWLSDGKCPQVPNNVQVWQIWAVGQTMESAAYQSNGLRQLSPGERPKYVDQYVVFHEMRSEISTE
ncbi:hypothetical protein DdX_20109 [Ditylenchus destructor]|uniref:Uncharacterized protein n=1 Tax=Ditylenchus destructor TaxID=166010 RepID=A0AAD4QWU3_9BILA|nr:hypothetical protein DdX_20109 [Ditylenchus destructor]